MLNRLGRIALPLAIVASLAAGVCQAQTVLTHQTRKAVQNGKAKMVGHMPANQVMHLVISLPLRNQAELNQFLKDVYDPASPIYRHFLTVDQFTARFGPTQADYDTLIQFAKENGFTVTGTSRNRVNLDVSGTVANVEKAFNVKLNVYQHPTQARHFFAPDRQPTTYLPFSLWHISGLDNYSIPHPAGLHKNPHPGSTTSNATVGSGPSASFLGSDMRAAYYGGTALDGSGQSLGLLEFYGTDLADVNTYYNNVHQTNNVPINLISTDGTSTSCLYSAGCDDGEQTLDITQALGMAPNLTALNVYVGSSDVAMLNAMATASPLDAQLSCSWAWTPADPSTDDPYFKEFAAQGQNFFVAAGDSGAWPTPKSPYYFPADDAYVTTVGGTDLYTSSAGGPWSSESAWANGGGGISPDNIPIPSWQQTTAASCSTCSTTYRNAPDVSANANYSFYLCADQSSCTANLYGGTSFAAPMWAGYLALVNQQSVANGNGPVGFINPSLYSIGNSGNFPTDFHDITSGNNGYAATSGYDLATGWGSPNGSGLIDALAGVSSPGFTLSASSSSLSIAPGNSDTSSISFTPSGGFSGTVALTSAVSPSGPTVSFSPTSISGTQTSTMTVNVPSGTSGGTYTITVTGTSGSTTSSTTVTLTVTAPSFTLSASPSSVSITQGKSGSSTISSSVSGGFNSAIGLTATGQPSGVTVSFNPTSITGAGNSTMSITVGSSVPGGTYPITVTGTSGSIVKTTTVTLTVTVPAGFTLAASPSTLSLAPGASGSSTISSTYTGGYSSPINLSATVSPSGPSVRLNHSKLSGHRTANLTVNVPSGTSAGTYIITVTGTSGSIVATTTVTLTVTGSSGSFALSASPSSLSLAQGASGNSTITSTVSGGFSSAISLTASGQPAGVTVGFSPGSITGAGTATMSITVGASVATGTYPITVTGTSGSTTATTTVTLTVTSGGSGSFALSASPSSLSLAQGASGNSTITSTVSGGFSSAISLTASGQPAGVTVGFSPGSITGAGTATMSITVGASVATGTYPITVTGTSGSTTATTTVTLTVTGSGSGDFSLSASPTSISVAKGSSGNVTIDAVVTGSLGSAISLSASGQPGGATISFSPASISTTGGSSTMIISVGNGGGSHAITVTGTSGGISHSVTVNLNITK